MKITSNHYLCFVELKVNRSIEETFVFLNYQFETQSKKCLSWNKIHSFSVQIKNFV